MNSTTYIQFNTWLVYQLKEKILVVRISVHVSLVEGDKIDVFLKRIKNRLLKTPRSEKSFSEERIAGCLIRFAEDQKNF